MSIRNGMRGRSFVRKSLSSRDDHHSDHPSGDHCSRHKDDPCCNCSLDVANKQCTSVCLLFTMDQDGHPISPSAPPFPTTSGAVPTSTTAPLPSLGQNDNQQMMSMSESNGTKHLPVIIGASIGGVIVLILLALGIFLCVRRKRRQPHKAPSAEFLENGGGLLRRMHTAGSMPIHSPSVSVYGGPVTEVPMGADVLNDHPPAFTSGNFRDPVVEKVTRAHQTVAAYHQRAESRAAASREGDQAHAGSGMGASPRVGVGFPNR